VCGWTCIGLLVFHVLSLFLFLRALALAKEIPVSNRQITVVVFIAHFGFLVHLICIHKHKHMAQYGMKCECRLTDISYNITAMTGIHYTAALTQREHRWPLKQSCQWEKLLVTYLTQLWHSLSVEMSGSNGQLHASSTQQTTSHQRLDIQTAGQACRSHRHAVYGCFVTLSTTTSILHCTCPRALKWVGNDWCWILHISYVICSNKIQS